MVSLALLLASPAHAEDDHFHPGSGPETVSYAALLRSGAVLGRSGHLLVGSNDAAAVRAVPGVDRVEGMPGGVLRVHPAPGTSDLALARTLHALPGVRWVNPDLILPLSPRNLPDDPLLADEWHLDNVGQGGRTVDVDINAPLAWEHASGTGQLIAVIDSGVELLHPDLRVHPGHDYIDRDDDPSPDESSSGPHGTACAGVAAGAGDNAYGVAGVAWGADVYAIRLIGGSTSLDDLYSAFVEAVDAGAGVLSNSWGFGESCEPVQNYGTFGDMFNYAEDEGRGGLGSVVVFAAGNGGCDIADDGMLNHKKLLVVAAIEGNDRRAWYSSYGDAVDLAAPTGLLTTDIQVGGYGSYNGDEAYADGFSGTSASTPVVAGVVALMMEANPRLSAAQIREVLCATAVRNDVASADYDEDGRSAWYGCGRVDAGAAVAAVADHAPEAPVPTPLPSPSEARVQLVWSAAPDADGDLVRHELAWWVDGTSEADATPIAVEGLAYSLTGQVAAGDHFSWKVRGVDPWGPGPWSVSTSVAVDAVPQPPEAETPAAAPDRGCTSSPSTAVGATPVVLLLLRRRRRPA